MWDAVLKVVVKLALYVGEHPEVVKGVIDNVHAARVAAQK